MKDNEKAGKWYYAASECGENSTCFKFTNPKQRAEIAAQCNLVPITATEAMKRFGYTNGAGRRDIEAEQW